MNVSPYDASLLAGLVQKWIEETEGRQGPEAQQLAGLLGRVIERWSQNGGLDPDNRLPCWAVVEIKGHSTLAGYCREVVLVGVRMLEIEVPAVAAIEIDSRNYPAVPHFTKWVPVHSIHQLGPCSEEAARAQAAHIRHIPNELRAVEWLARMTAISKRKRVVTMDIPPKDQFIGKIKNSDWMDNPNPILEYEAFRPENFVCWVETDGSPLDPENPDLEWRLIYYVEDDRAEQVHQRRCGPWGEFKECVAAMREHAGLGWFEARPVGSDDIPF